MQLGILPSLKILIAKHIKRSLTRENVVAEMKYSKTGEVAEELWEISTEPVVTQPELGQLREVDQGVWDLSLEVVVVER